MEFKFRAGEDRPPTYAPPPSSLGFFMEPAAQGPNSRPTPDPTNIPNSMHVQEAIQRKIEKEQIRQEIIAGETSRRRELVAEVMREMAMEREMAMRRGAEMGMPFDERLTMWIDQRLPSLPPYGNHWINQQLALAYPVQCAGPYNFKTSPSPMAQHPQFQLPEASVAKVTPGPEPGKGKLIVLDRPDPTLCAAKRKAAEPPAVGAGELYLLSSKKKLKEEWSCALCQVTATCERGLNEHLQGKKHKSKEAGLRAEKMVKNATTGESSKKVSSNLTVSKQNDKTEKMGINIKCMKDSKIKFWCEICNVGTMTKAVMARHKQGRKHRARFCGQNDHPEAASAAKTLLTSDAATKETEIEYAATEEERVAVAEAKGEDQIAEEANREQMETEQQRRKKGKLKLWCGLCNIGPFSEAVMETHKLGRKHKARLEQQICCEAVHTTKPTSTASPGITTAITMLPPDKTKAIKNKEAAPKEEKLEDEMSEETEVVDQIAKKVKGRDPIVDERKQEDYVAEEVRVEGAVEGAEIEDPRAKEMRVKEANGKELKGEDLFAEKVNGEELKAGNSIVDEEKEENTTVEKVKGEDPTVEKAKTENRRVEEVEGEDLTLEEVKEGKGGREGKGDDPTVEEGKGAGLTVEEARGVDSTVDSTMEVEKREQTKEEEVEETKEEEMLAEEVKVENAAQEEVKEDKSG